MLKPWSNHNLSYSHMQQISMRILLRTHYNVSYLRFSAGRLYSWTKDNSIESTISQLKDYTLTYKGKRKRHWISRETHVENIQTPYN